MFIYTDDLKFAAKVLPSTKSWQKIDISKDQNSDLSFIFTFYETTELFSTEIKKLNTWQYLLLTKYSKQSQFDLLYNLNKTNLKLPDKILCLAESGSNFHGYRNREWKANSGNLHLSIYLKPNKSVPNFNVGFTILAAISVIETIDSIPQLKNKSNIKWVNDILIDNSKIGGVITQTQSQNDIVTALVMGIGLNISYAPIISKNKFITTTTSIEKHIDKSQLDFSEIFLNLIHNLFKNYTKLLHGDYQQLLYFYIKKSIILNKHVQIYSDPLLESDTLIAKGKVLKIGYNLELYLEGLEHPIRSGRLVIL